MTQQMPTACRTVTAIEWGFIVRRLLRTDPERAKQVAEGQETFVEDNAKIFPPKGTLWTIDGSQEACRALSPLQTLEAMVGDEDRVDALALRTARPSEAEHLETRRLIRHTGLQRVRETEAEAAARAPRMIRRSGTELAELIEKDASGAREVEETSPLIEPIKGFDSQNSGVELAQFIEAERLREGSP